MKLQHSLYICTADNPGTSLNPQDHVLLRREPAPTSVLLPCLSLLIHPYHPRWKEKQTKYAIYLIYLYVYESRQNKTKGICNPSQSNTSCKAEIQCTTMYSRLSLSWIPRDSLKYFEISVPRHIRFAELGKKLIPLTTFNKYMCNWTLEVKDNIENIVEKRRNCSLGAISPLFHNIFYMLLDFHV